MHRNCKKIQSFFQQGMKFEAVQEWENIINLPKDQQCIRIVIHFEWRYSTYGGHLRTLMGTFDLNYTPSFNLKRSLFYEKIPRSRISTERISRLFLVNFKGGVYDKKRDLERNLHILVSHFQKDFAIFVFICKTNS